MLGAGWTRRPATSRPAPEPPASAAAAHHPREALAFGLRRVGAAAVELLVARHQVGPLRPQPVHEHVAHLAAQVQRDARDARRAGLLGGFQQRLDLVRRVVDPGHQRRDQHARRDARAVELGDRLQARPRVGRVRLGFPPGLLVERRDRQARAELADPLAQSGASARGRAAAAATSSGPSRGCARRAAPPRSPPSAGSGPRPTGRGRCSCPARRVRPSTTAAPARRAAPRAR